MGEAPSNISNDCGMSWEIGYRKFDKEAPWSMHSNPTSLQALCSQVHARHFCQAIVSFSPEIPIFIVAEELLLCAGFALKYLR